MTDHLGPVAYFEILQDVLPELAHGIPGELEASNFAKLRHVIVDADDPYPGCHRLDDVVGAGASGAGNFAARVPGDPDYVRGWHVSREIRRAGGPGRDDIFTILYTSGSPSFPKGPRTSARNRV